MKAFRGFGVVCAVVLLAGCGGGSANATPEAVVRSYIAASLEGRSSAAFDLLHPGIQAKTTRDAFIACAAKTSTGTITPNVKVTEVTAVKYTRLDGGQIDASAVSLTLSSGALSSNYTMWVADGRIVDSKPVSDKPCVERL